MTDAQAHADALYASLGQAATFAPRTGPALAVTLLRAAAPEVQAILDAEVQGPGYVWKVRKSEVAHPKVGDRFQLTSGTLLEIQADPETFGRHGVQWRLDCREVN